MTAPISFSGIESGLNTTSIINAEMSIFEQPLNNLVGEQTSLNQQVSDYQTLNSDLLSLQQAGDALATPSAYSQAFSVSSSNSSVATGSITGSSDTGSISLAVDQLATNSTQISAGTVSATNDVIASGSYLVGSGGAALGIMSFSGTSGLATGSHSISVTQASAGASASGTTAVASSTTIGTSNDTVGVSIDGTAYTFTVASGTYTQSQLAQAVAQASGGLLSATVNGSGIMTLSTVQQGSSASLQVTGGTALTAVGMSTGSVTYGTNGIINVDGTANSISSVSATGTTQVTLTSGTGGTITANLSGPLNVGTMQANNVSVGNGSLASVVSAINGANVGVTATALQVGTNSYALELTSNKTGLTGAATIDTQAFTSSSLGAMQTTTAAQDAIVSVGGTGGYQVTSNTNNITGLFPGVTVQVDQVSTTPVTLNIGADGTNIANNVQTLVNAANKALSDISKFTAYNQTTNTAGPLNGQSALTGLAQQILSLVGNTIGSSAAGADGTGESAGLAITSSGQITFDKNAFISAYNANPSAVQAMFTEGGTFNPSSSTYSGGVSVAGATNNTVPGTYAVVISHSATQATDTGSVSFASSTATLASAETYTIASGSLTATYAATAGESIANVISGINAATAASGINVSAALVGSSGAYNVQLTSGNYGSGATFTVAASGTDQLGLTSAGSTYTGSDVAGTINGLTATGVGRTLTLNDSGNPANGLVLKVGIAGITAATSVGSVSYSPGMAQTLASLSANSIVAPGGLIADNITRINDTLSGVASQITTQKQLVATEKKLLTEEFVKMEEALAQLSSQTKFMQSYSGSSSSGTSSSSSGTLSGG
jgi:flagellar hook-associated protein 2